MRIRKSVSKLQTKLLHTVQDIIENAPVDPDNLTNEDTDDLVGIESPAKFTEQGFNFQLLTDEIS